MASLSDIVSTLEKEDVIPEVIPGEFSPSISFSIAWANGKSTMGGNFLTREDTLDEPELHFTSPTKDGATYTLVMTDPDAPSRTEPKYRQFRHWVITGLKRQGSNDLAEKPRPSVTPYRPPGPPPGSFVHRYTFLLFEEPESGFTIPGDAPEYGAALEERRTWDAMKFGNRYGLKLVGANLFLVQAAEKTT